MFPVRKLGTDTEKLGTDTNFPVFREIGVCPQFFPSPISPSASHFFPSSLTDEINKIKKMERACILPPVLEEGQIVTEMNLITIGDLKLLTIPGELFVEIGLDILRQAPEPCWIITHCNDAIGYIPTAEAFDEGGYESSPFALSLLTPEAEGIVKNEATKLLA